MDGDFLFFGFVGVIVVLLVGGIGYAIYDEATAEHFTLRKDQWECTASHLETTFTQQSFDDGKTFQLMPVVNTVCDRYERIKR